MPSILELFGLVILCSFYCLLIRQVLVPLGGPLASARGPGNVVVVRSDNLSELVYHANQYAGTWAAMLLSHEMMNPVLLGCEESITHMRRPSKKAGRAVFMACTIDRFEGEIFLRPKLNACPPLFHLLTAVVATLQNRGGFIQQTSNNSYQIRHGAVFAAWSPWTSWILSSRIP